MTGYVLKMFPRFSETFILAEILELERRGRPIHVISLKKPDDGRFHGDLARVRAPVEYLSEHARCHPSVYVRAHIRWMRERPAAYLSIMRNALRHRGEAWKAFLKAPLVADAARSAGCDRLHAHFASLPAIVAMYASELAGLPFTFTAHAKDIFLDDRSPALLRRLMHRARRVVTVSDFNVEYLRGIGGRELPADRIARIYNGIDLRAFRSVPRIASSEPPLILAVGRLVEKKGFADLIRACARLREDGVRARCEIVGKGALQADLSRRIVDLGLDDRVQLVGPLPREKVAQKLQQAAVLAVPCVVGKDGNRDGLPTVILEAMAAGVPVVATDVTGIPEAVEDGVNGRVLSPGDVASFATALRQLLEDATLRARMSRAGRQRAESLFDIERNVEQLDCVMHDGASAPPATASGSPLSAPRSSFAGERPS